MKGINNLIQKIKVFAPKAILSFSLLILGAAMTMGDMSHTETQKQLNEELIILQAKQEELLNKPGFKEFSALDDIDKTIEELIELNQSYINEKNEIIRIKKEEKDKRIAEEKAEQERIESAKKSRSRA